MARPLQPLDALGLEAIASVAAQRPAAPSGCAEHPDWRDELDACLRSGPDGFAHFLRHWHFRNRDALRVQTFQTLWRGQERLRDRIIASERAHRWVYALKAGKLGFTELECAYDGWKLLAFPHARVHVFSRAGESAVELLSWVKYGLERMPPYFGVGILRGQRGGDTGDSLKLQLAPEAGWLGRDDTRRIVAYAAGPNVSIDQVATHSHVDELSHMPFPDKTWGAIYTTVAPGDPDLGAPPGTLHIITRGAGEGVYTAELWHEAMAGRDEETFEPLEGARPASLLDPLFCDWRHRPRQPQSYELPPDASERERQDAWYEEQAATTHVQALSYFAPNVAADALAGDLTAIYIPIERWDSRFDPSLIPPAFELDRSTPVVLAVDAAVSGDHFGIVGVIRHPTYPTQAAVVVVRQWIPVDGTIQYEEPEGFLRWYAGGGCARGHPLSWLRTPERVSNERIRGALERCPDCEAIRGGAAAEPPFNIVQITYDPHQLHDMMSSLRNESIAWCDPFDQGAERLIADGQLHKLTLRGEVWHNGSAELREHIQNAKAKLQPEEESKMRIVKRSERSKVDLAVATSMAVKRSLDLNLW